LAQIYKINTYEQYRLLDVLYFVSIKLLAVVSKINKNVADSLDFLALKNEPIFILNDLSGRSLRDSHLFVARTNLLLDRNCVDKPCIFETVGNKKNAKAVASTE